jgi:nifR3 family TIM-barrel protein
MKPLNIKNVPIPVPVLLAPLAGFTDCSFRALCHGFGAGLTFTEMVSAKSIVYNNANAKILWDNEPQVQPWAVQFFGHEPEVMGEAVKRLESVPFTVTDINMGCPVPKIVKNGDGCALMLNPLLAGRIIEAAVAASPRPVTVKIRKGISGSDNAAEMAKVAQESGASAVTVHGRTREQYYAGEADREAIAAVKAAVSIPVIGNGDVFTPRSAGDMFAQTGCDGVMVARGALGNPWLFAQTALYLQTGKLPPAPSWEERRETALGHLRMTTARKGEPAGVREMRKHLCFYIKGLPEASALRRQINTLGSAAELERLLAGVQFPNATGGGWPV